MSRVIIALLIIWIVALIVFCMLMAATAPI